MDEIVRCASAYDVDKLRKLITSDNINDHDIGGGMTPLHHVCCWFDSVDLVQELVDMGADIHAKDNDGWTPLHLTACYCKMDSMRALLENGASVNSLNNDSKTPLAVALRWNNLDCARLLLDHNATMNVCIYIPQWARNFVQGREHARHAAIAFVGVRRYRKCHLESDPHIFQLIARLIYTTRGSDKWWSERVK